MIFFLYNNISLPLFGHCPWDSTMCCLGRKVCFYSWPMKKWWNSLLLFVCYLTVKWHSSKINENVHTPMNWSRFSTWWKQNFLRDKITSNYFIRLIFHITRTTKNAKNSKSSQTDAPKRQWIDKNVNRNGFISSQTTTMQCMQDGIIHLLDILFHLLSFFRFGFEWIRNKFIKKYFNSKQKKCERIGPNLLIDIKWTS